MPRASNHYVPGENYESLRSERYGLRAGLYALWLRNEGHTPAAAAQLVAERYPRLREQLAKVMATPEEGDTNDGQQRREQQ